MITKEEFIELISDYKKWTNKVNTASNLLDIPNLFESDLISYGSILFDSLINILFNECGADHISWWLYEKNGREDMKMWDKNKNEIPTDSIIDLWNIVKEYRK